MSGEVTDEQLDQWQGLVSSGRVPAFVALLIADLRTSRAREAESRATIETLIRSHGDAVDRMAGQRAALQQRINAVLARCDAADTDQTPRLMHVTLLDPRAVRAALTRTEPDHA